ncbi:MAG: hypothetical protein WAQ05_00680 [Rubrivivax sp.]
MTALPFRDLAGVPDDDHAATAPPPDVQRMLQRHGAVLPHYFDAQRAAAAQRSRTDWPRLWGMAPEPPA